MIDGGGADLQLFFAFEIIERHSGCKSWWLNSPKIHLSLQIDSYCISYKSGFCMQPGLELQSSPWGMRACALGSVPSSRGKPIPWCPSETVYLAWRNSEHTWELCFGIQLWRFQVVFEKMFSFYKKPFFPIVQKFKKFTSKKVCKRKMLCSRQWSLF